MNGETEIRALLAARLAAIKTKDVAASIRHIGPEAVVFDLAPPLALSGAQAGDPESTQQWFDTWQGPIMAEMQALTVHTSGDLAIAHALIRLSGTREAGDIEDFWFRSTVGLKRVDGTWRIVHEHNSFPMLMDGSDKAATDLAP